MRNELRSKKSLFPRDNEDGIALIAGLGIMVILTILGAASLFTTNIDIMITKNYEMSIQALYAAEAGAEKVYDAFQEGDTNGDGVVDDNDTANANNDLDGDGTIDFIQVFQNKVDIGSDANRITVNANSNIQAFIWVDASNAPAVVLIHSRGNPAGTKSRKDITLTLTSTGGGVINGALNNST
jgi:hypothetical protein